MTLKTRRKLFWISVFAFLIAAPPIILYTTGWRLTSDFKIKRTGGLFVAVPESGSEVYLQGKPVKKTNFLQSGVFIQNLTPGPYSLLVTKDGLWPWAKEIQIAQSAVAEAKALTLSQSITGNTLLNGPFETVYASGEDEILVLEEKKDKKYNLTFYLPKNNEFLSPANSSTKKLLSNSEKLKTIIWSDSGAEIFLEKSAISLNFNFTNRSVSAKSSQTALDDTLPALPHKVFFDKRQNARAWRLDREIWVEWLASSPLPYYLQAQKEMVFETKSLIRNAAFMPKRDDVLMVAIENGVFAMEIDSRGKYNFQPVYKGKEPNFALLGNEIYVLDEGILSKLDF